MLQHMHSKLIIIWFHRYFFCLLTCPLFYFSFPFSIIVFLFAKCFFIFHLSSLLPCLAFSQSVLVGCCNTNLWDKKSLQILHRAKNRYEFLLSTKYCNAFWPVQIFSTIFCPVQNIEIIFVWYKIS